MPKLFTLGCSLTYSYGWKDVLADKIDYELVNSAMYAGSNNLQVKRIHNYIANNQINKDDIIIWQITGQLRSSFSVAMCDEWKDKLNYIPDHNTDPRFDNMNYYVSSPANYFDSNTHVDVLSNHPLIKDASEYYDFAQSLEELLSTIILLNNTYKVLVFVGWNGALTEAQANYNKFMQALAANNVPHMSESLVDWVISNKYKLDFEDPTGLHPTMEASEAYANLALYPKLQEMGWV